MPGALLEVRGLTIEIVRDGVRYRVIDGVDLTIDRGESVAMVGESASGKSLIAMGAIDLLGAGARVLSGTTVFEGTLLQDLDDADWRFLVGMGIGVLFQDAIGSWDPLDVMGYQSGEALLEHTELSAEEVVRRVRDALGEVGLPKGRHFSTYVHEVSRGQAQRAMLAATLLSAPRLLIADEPLSGLDVTVARAVLDLIDDAVKLKDLLAPPGNKLEKLKGDLHGRYSIRINDQFRLIFAFSKGAASKVQIADYH